MTDRLIIFDTTMRDGEQSPGASMTKAEKIRIAKALERLKVDVIEAGFPIASPGDFEAVQAVARTIKDCTVCGLSRTGDADIDRAYEALKDAPSYRIHTFIATSPIHMQNKLKMAPDEVLEAAIRAVKRARNYTNDVEFSCEDSSRSEFEFLAKVVEAVIAAGATTINLPDTVGYAVPEQYGAFIRRLRETVPNSDKAVFSVHCHNDLGLAVGNSLAAVMNGARQVECTINGLGERAGNASLEELVMAVRTRKDYFPCETRIETTEIMNCSRLVSTITGFPVQPNKAIVGANAFAHESGIHQDGVLKHRETYEIMRAQDVGWNSNRIVLGKLSGRNALRTRLKELGIEFAQEADFIDTFKRFKDLADRKTEIYDEDLQALVSDTEISAANERVQLVAMRVASETGKTPQAELTLAIDGVEHRTASEGDGPVDAAYRAVEALMKSGVRLQLYSVNAITTGTDSQGEVTVRLERAGRIVNGQGADTDIIVASVKAYLNALNKVLYPTPREHPQTGQV
ncbi:MAG: 2-isopropylmalate synthase [Gammaproteobacteria bacterium]|nr:2-isopropylmalate synthase [Gammaproteobacteria bacterium]